MICNVFVTAMTSVSGVTTVYTIRSSNLSLIIVTGCGNYCLRNECFAANRAVRAFGKTGFSTSRSNSFVGYNCVTGSGHSNCFSADFVSTADGAVNYAIVFTVNGTSRIYIIFLNCLCRSMLGELLAANVTVMILIVISALAYYFATVFTNVSTFSSCVCAKCLAAVVITAVILVCVNVRKSFTICSATLIACLLSSAGSGIIYALVLNHNSDCSPSSATLIPCASLNCVVVCSISGNLEVCSLVPLIVPVVSSSVGVHTAEDNVRISRRNFNLINAKLGVICHVNPLFAVTEEVCRKSCAINLPVRVGCEVKHRLYFCLTENSFCNCSTSRAFTALNTVSVGCGSCYNCPNLFSPYVTGSYSLNLTANCTNRIGCASYVCKLVVARIIIPNACIVNYSVTVACFREVKVGSLKNLVVPIVCCVVVHANEDKFCISVKDFSLVYAITIFIGHICPGVGVIIYEEVNSES